MNSTLQSEPRRSSLQDAIAEAAKRDGFVQVERYEFEEAFPHPARLSRAEIDDMITLALVGNIPPPPEEPTQQEKLDKFCKGHHLIVENHPWMEYVVFRALGIPPELRSKTKSSLCDCEIGESVHESDVPIHLRRDRMIEHAAKRHSPYSENYRECRKITVTTMLFERRPLFNGESMFIRIR